MSLINQFPRFLNSKFSQKVIVKHLQGEHSAIQELASALQVPVLTLVDMDDLISYLALGDNSKDNTHENGSQLAKMQHYRQQYGV